jgi:hypothetical protein
MHNAIEVSGLQKSFGHAAVLVAVGFAGFRRRDIG